tara:strand:- start:3055 stop:3462 length:408 start_codon:yes stop_codon:yes gene_type:complete
MNKYMSLLFLPAMMLTACQIQPETVQEPQAVFNTKVIIIENSQLNQYWSLEQIKPVIFNKRPDWLPRGVGKAEYYTTIDSNGNEVSKELVSSQPEGWMTQTLINKMPKQQYEPAASNLKRVPVKVKMDFETKRRH